MCDPRNLFFFFLVLCPFWSPSLSHHQHLSLPGASQTDSQISFRNRRRGEREGERTMGPTSSRMSTKRKRTGQSSSRSGAAREPPQQQLLPDDIERENAAVLNKLPRDVWEKVVGLLDWNDSHFQFALTCRYFRDLLQERADAERKRRREDARTTTWYAPSPERLSRKYGAYFETTLQSYTYISTHDFDDEMYSATIDDRKYPLLPLILLCLLSLTTLCLVQSSVTTTTSSSTNLLTMSSGSSGRPEVLIVGRRL